MTEQETLFQATSEKLYQEWKQVSDKLAAGFELKASEKNTLSKAQNLLIDQRKMNREVILRSF